MARGGRQTALLLPEFSSSSFKYFPPSAFPSLQVIPASFTLEPGQSRGVLFRAVAPDLMYAQQYPLAAAVQFLRVGLMTGPGTGAWRAFDDGPSAEGGDIPPVVCVEVDH
jgi:hypothetical protein